MALQTVEKHILDQVAGLSDVPTFGAFNIRVNGASAGRSSSANIDIIPKENNPGIDIFIKPNTKNETVYIPVVLSESGLNDMVYNDFYIGENSEVTIIAGCGIHNCGEEKSQHDGIHTFHCGKNSNTKYVEKHYGEGDGKGQNVLNPVTVIKMDDNSTMEMETVQIRGVDSTHRETNATVGENCTLVINEKLMTHGDQYAKTDFNVDLNGVGASCNVVSRSVAKENSEQIFASVINGNNDCYGHSECDAIIMDNASVKAIPDVTANHVDAQLIHEAAIGKIAGDQITKLMTLGLSEEAAEAQIVNGFLR